VKRPDVTPVITDIGLKMTEINCETKECDWNKLGECTRHTISINDGASCLHYDTTLGK